MKKQIVFFCATTPYVMIYKIAREFKKRGYETVLVTLSQKDKFNQNFFEDAFDKILCSDFQFFKPNLKTIPYILQRGPKFLKFLCEIKKIKPYVWFGVGRTNWPVRVIHKYFFKKYPFIYFEYDINSQMYLSREEARKVMPNFEIDAEKYCFEHAEGLMHKGDPEEIKHLNNRIFKEIKLPNEIINFLPYCSDEYIVPINKNKLSKFDKEFHIVYIGGVTNLPESNKIVHKILKSILNQGIHVHIYGKTQHISVKDTYDYIKDNLSEFRKNKYFHLHKGLDPKEIIPEISKYDYGLWFTDLHTENNPEDTIFCTGNKISSYLEAGIPFIYYDQLKFINKILKKYSLQFSFNYKNIDNLKNRIKQMNKRIKDSDLIAAREDFNIKNHFFRLEKFVKNLVEKYKKFN